MDFDGSFTYSETKALEVKSALVNDFYPTVVHEGSASIFIKVGYDAEYTVEVITTLGQVVESHQAEMKSTQYYELKLDIAKYASEMYFVRISNGTDSMTHKIRVE